MSSESKVNVANFDANAANDLMDRYSRQVAAIGVDTMKNMGSLKVLVVGQQGVGVEAAKDLVLQGPKAVTVWDNGIATMADLGTNFYLTQANVGKDKRSCVSKQLQELNPYVDVAAYEGELSDSFILQFGAVIITTHIGLKELYRINALCRKNKISFVLAVTYGVCASFFTDFGDSHLVTDLDGEPKRDFVIQHVSVDQIQVTVDQHDLDDDDEVVFSDIVGPLSVLNDKTGIRVKRMYTKQGSRSLLVLNKFRIDVSKMQGGQVDLTKLDWKDGGGIFSVSKPSKMLHFRSLEESFKNPVIADEDFGMVKHMNEEKFFKSKGTHLHLGLLALYTFQERKGRLPLLHNTADANECVKIAEEIRAEQAKLPEGKGFNVEKVDATEIKKIALYARVELTGYCAFLGGVAAQEVLKKFGKWTPAHQWLHMDMFELTGDNVPFDATPQNSRYDHQISVFGQAFQHNIQNQKWFLVGCGALGCEYIKAFSLMGLGAGLNGQVYITDMDRIEVSNLARQFLFRSQHVGKPKSVSAADVAKTMNPDMRVTCYEQKVFEGTENLFVDSFWDNLTGVWNALDNVQARRYTDSKCLIHGKPLMESGTQGTKANSDVILPYKTSSYSDQPEQETGGIAACTLRNFPNTIVHCIEWAKPKFQELFELHPATLNTFLTAPQKFFENVEKQVGDKSKIEFMSEIKAIHAAPKTWEGAIQLSWLNFHQKHRDAILDLTHYFPQDARNVETKTGADLGPFWTGAKRFPSAAVFEIENDDHLRYMWNCCNLYAFMFGLEQERDLSKFKSKLQSLKPAAPEWKPPLTGPTDIVDKKEQNENKDGDKADAGANEGDSDAEAALANELKQLLEYFHSHSTSEKRAAIKPMQVTEFEKDDDKNFHVDFITCSSNLRAWNYKIKPANRLQVKSIAGKIIPALATTTAMITGLVCLEFYKLTAGLHYLKKECFLNANVNLALSKFNFFEPDAPRIAQPALSADGMVCTKPYPAGFTTWNYVEVRKGDMTIAELVDLFPKLHYNLKVKSLFKRGASTFLYVDEPDVPPRQAIQMLKNPNLSAGHRATFQNQVDAYNAKVEKRKKEMNASVKDLYISLYGPLPAEDKSFVLLEGAFYCPPDDTAIPDNIQKEIDALKKSGSMEEEDEVEVSASAPTIKFYF